MRGPALIRVVVSSGCWVPEHDRAVTSFPAQGLEYLAEGSLHPLPEVSGVGLELGVGPQGLSPTKRGSVKVRGTHRGLLQGPAKLQKNNFHALILFH